MIPQADRPSNDNDKETQTKPQRQIKLDKIDWKILKALVENSRQPITHIAKSALISKQSCHYRMQRLEQDGVIRKYKTRIDATCLGLSTYSIAIRFLGVDETSEKQIIDGISAISQVRWLVQSTGRWDCLIAVSSHDNKEFNSVLKKVLNAVKNHLFEYDTSIVMSTNDLWLKDSYAIKNELLESGKEKIENIDDKDRKILALLQENARLENTKIAKQVKLTAEAVAYRIKRLIKSRLIHSFTISADRELLGFMWFQIQLLLNNIDEIQEQKILRILKTIEGVNYIVHTLGKWNFEIHLYCTNVAEFRTRLFTIRELLKDNIRTYDVSIILNKKVSRTFTI